MLRKALTLGMVFIFALSLLAVSMITCFTYEAEAHYGVWCDNLLTQKKEDTHFGSNPGFPWCCHRSGTH